MIPSTTDRPDLAPLLHAGSVAIVGISHPGRFGGQVYANLRDFGYPGQIYGVNPRYTTLYDQPCYPSLAKLPERPDCAILAIANARLLPVLEEAAELEIPAAVIFASAYAEPVEGQPTLSDRLAEVARSSQMVICGPNGMGFHAFGQRLVVSGCPVTPGTPSGGVTFITHSGSVFDAFWQNNRGIRCNYVISSGNEIVTTMADYMLFALDDPSTRVVALFLEAVRDPERFMDALRMAAEHDLPVVALKVGRSQRGAELAQAHSGALAGEDAVYDALFDYYGVRRVKSLDEMMDALELFVTRMRPPTRYISAIQDSGGQRALLVDLAESEGVLFTPLNEVTTARLAEALEPGLDPINPLDAWGTGRDYERLYRECTLALDADPATGLNIFAVDLYPSGNAQSYVDLALALSPKLERPLVFLTHLATAVDQAQSTPLREAGIPVLLGTENGLRAIRHLVEYCEFQRRGAVARPEGERTAIAAEDVDAWRHTLQASTGPLEGAVSKQLLQAYGVPVAAESVVANVAEAVQQATEIGYPVALKTAEGSLHKTDREGVQLNLRDGAMVAEAYEDLAARFGPRVLVQQMVREGLELLLGAVNDAQFGPLLTIGMGGKFVELFQDCRLLLLPTTEESVRQALAGLRGAALLQGARGMPPVDVGAVVEVGMRLAALAVDLGDLLSEIDINPLIALPEGAVAVDALVIPSGARSEG